MLACGVRASQPAAARANKQAVGLVSLPQQRHGPVGGRPGWHEPAGWKLHQEASILMGQLL